MKRLTIFLAVALFILTGCNWSQNDRANSVAGRTSLCSDACKAGNKNGKVACSLTSPELQKRRETVLASLKAQMVDKKELKDGYAFKFAGNDKMVDELVEFVKTERECCGFFTFGLSVSGDKSEAWLELTGPGAAKEFIGSELAM